METSVDKLEWINRFVSRLGALVPNVDVADALERAQQTYFDGCDLVPEECAEVHALEMGPLDAGPFNG